MNVKFPPLHNNITLKSEEESECFSLLNVAAQNGDNVAGFTAESWCCGPNSRTTRGTVPSYTAVAHV